ncbi:MAG TPA: hypothetical protein VLJ61_17290 [Pyrinomonadaceae bacterium]|nr:hypothetical protein [Pyrinomonadaceae bacterium]
MSFMIANMAAHIFILLALLSVASTASAQSAGTKPIYSIDFKPDEKTKTVEGVVSPTYTTGPDMTNEGSERYFIRARAGQYLTVSVSSNDRQALFSLVKPSPGMSEYEIVEKAGGVRRWSGRLTKSGDYLVSVFTREKENSHFKLRVTLR